MPPNHSADLPRLLSELEGQRFYGSLEVRFEAGQVVLIRKTETLNPRANGYRENRGSYDGTKQF